MTFVNRTDAGVELAAALQHLRGEKPIVLALPRGGVPVAAEVADALDAPLDLIFARKIGAPGQPELAIGAVVDGGEPVVVRIEALIKQTGTSEAEFQSICDKQLTEIRHRRWLYLNGRPALPVEGHTAIIVDDGIATGATMMAALRSLRLRKPKRLVLAVPVAPPDTLDMLRPEADEIVCLERHEPFGAVGFFYRDFAQVTDQQVVQILEKRAVALAAKS